MKQVILVRRDLDMGTGKLAAQVGHAAISAYESADADAKRTWRQDGQTKVVLGVDDESELLSLADQAARAGLPYATIRDAGRTQLDPHTLTALGIGPAAADRIDTITGHLDLY